MRAQKGQIVVVLAFALVVIVLLTLLNVDTFTAVRAKNRVQNAGDAAALAAAHRQGELLNRIGRLNIDHIIAAAHDETNECRAIVLEQRRLALLGPVEALRFANDAAKRNGMCENEGFSRILREHVRDIRLVYADGTGGEGDPYPEAWPGAWTEYASAIEAVVGEGLATGPDNIMFYCGLGGHLLLDRRFYHAIAARDWCWFHFNCPEVLASYTAYNDWDPLPARWSNPLDNSEVFSLFVASRRFPLTRLFTPEELEEILSRFSEERVTRDDIASSALLSDPEEPWFLLDPANWSRWFNGMTLADDPNGGVFPLAGEIKPEYNVRGCAAMCRCEKTLDAVAVDSTSDVVWSAAAKPFGTLADINGEVGPVTALRSFLVPCFSEVRLVPLDSVGGESLATADESWVAHIRHHLPAYMVDGPRSNRGCFYCQQLRTWERRSFRRTGIIWLKHNSGQCRRPTGGGPGGTGGTSHAH